MKLYSLFIILILLIINAKANNDINIDSDWMSYISPDKYLHQINIPNTHDTDRNI